MKQSKALAVLSLLRFDNAQVAIGIGNAILLFNGLAIEVSGLRISSLIQHERLLEATQVGLELQNLRGGPGETNGVDPGFSRFRTFLNALEAKLRRLNRKF